MSVKRKDEVDKYYKPAKLVSDIAKYVFWANLICTLILLFNLSEILASFIRVVSIVLTTVYTVLVAYHDLYLFKRAEDERRKVFISDALGIKSSTKKTVGYYNNIEKRSFLRLGIDCYESVYFTRKTTNKMLPIRLLGGIVTLLLYVAFLGTVAMTTITGVDKFDLALVITQTIFSSEILVSVVKLVLYSINLKNIEDGLYDLLIKNKPTNAKKLDALLLDAVMDYECLKSYYSIALSSKTFKKNNGQWSEEWKQIYDEIQTSEECFS